MSQLTPNAGHLQASIDALTPMLGGAPVEQVQGAYAERTDPPFLWERAYKDALKALRSIPDPQRFAASIDEHHREALRNAWRGQNGWRVGPECLGELRLLGLAEAGGIETENAHERNHLTAFGIAVRRVVMEAI